MLANWLYIMAGGLIVTLQLVALSGLIAIVLGAVLATMFVSPIRWIRALAQLYVDIFRSIPLLALLFFLYYVLGRYTHSLGLTSFSLAVIALALNEAAYVAEVYRGGLRSVPGAQWEAGKSIGLGWWSVFMRIIVPQALPPAMPATLNMIIQLIKNSALASLIAVNEVSMIATILVSETFKPLEVFSVLAVLYLAIVVPLTLVSSRAETLLARKLGLAAREARVPVSHREA